MSIRDGSDSSPARPHAEIAAVLRTRREALGLERKDVVAATGLSYPYVAQLEGGHRAPSLGTAAKLATLLGLTVDEIVGHARPDKPAHDHRYDNPGHRADASGLAVTGAWPAEAMAAPVMGLGSPSPAPTDRPPHRAARPRADLGAVVDEAVTLLARLPVEQRLDAAHRIQDAVIDQVVQDRSTGSAP